MYILGKALNIILKLKREKKNIICTAFLGFKTRHQEQTPKSRCQAFFYEKLLYLTLSEVDCNGGRGTDALGWDDRTMKNSFGTSFTGSIEISLSQFKQLRSTLTYQSIGF